MDSPITTEDAEAGSSETQGPGMYRPTWSLGFKVFLVIATLALAGGAMYMAGFVSLGEVSAQGMQIGRAHV